MDLKPPFVTTPVETIKSLKEFISSKPELKGKKVIDLGSGNGRVVFEFAKLGLVATGFEEKEDLVKISQEKMTESNLQNAQIIKADYWNQNISAFDIVYIYGIPAIMGKLEKKLLEELRKDVIIISNVYTFPHLKLKKTIGTLHIYSTSL